MRAPTRILLDGYTPCATRGATKEFAIDRLLEHSRPQFGGTNRCLRSFLSGACARRVEEGVRIRRLEAIGS